MQKLPHTVLNFYADIFYLLFIWEGGGHINLKNKHNCKGGSPGLLHYYKGGGGATDTPKMYSVIYEHL